ncbi:MAG: amino acid adenylation domain-containing protein [Rhodobacteraceae bacterium]|nr:amino acid adenylation domain-containing protein [Paracoccaceae bacterium]PHR62282.1 MAG: hypothetical protein COA47_04735 [Robiginitomaculum sp.]
MGALDNVADILPLSDTQLGMLFETIKHKAPPGTYVAIVSADIDGALEPDALKAAIVAAVQARDAFRACFIWKEVAQPLQVIRQNIDLPFNVVDLTDQTAAGFKAKCSALAEAERARAFDLTAAPLMRVTLLRQNPTRHHLIWAMHHMISDGWSTGVVMQDLAIHLAGGTVPQPAQFKDYLVWQKARDKSAERSFWAQYLSGLGGPTSINLRIGESDGPQMHRRCHTDGPNLHGLRAYARAQRVTLTTLLTSAWALVLRRYSASDDVIFGQTYAGRPADIAGIERAAGAFITTLPIRLHVDPATTWETYLSRAEADARHLRSHQFSALSDVRDAAPLGRETQLFETLFVIEDTPNGGAQTGPIRFTNMRATDASTFPLAVLVTPRDRLHFEAIYDPNALTLPIVGEMLSDFNKLLETVTGGLGTIADLTTASWSTAVAAPAIAEFEPVHETILAHAQSNPAADAVMSQDSGRLNYAALERASADIAARLQAAGIGKGDVVPIALERGADVVVAMLAILRTGAAYTPLDLDYPPARLAHILQAIAPRAIITTIIASARLPASQAKLFYLDEPDGPAPALTSVSIEPGDLAYVIFTSGSSGGPKGVMISHGNLCYATAARADAYPQPPSSFLLLSSFAFDSSVAGIYWTLAHGGLLVVSAPRLEQDLAALKQQIVDTKTSHFLCLPALYQTILPTLIFEQITNLSVVIVAGEAVPPALVAAHKNQLPHVRLFNEYGPTEATVWCAAADITDHNPNLDTPIGTPPNGTSLSICDPDGCPLPNGASGEIVVRGPGVALGYWQDKPGLAQGHYKTGDMGYVNADGQVVFQGRTDAQVKIRGHRIELSEVEGALSQVTGADTVVLVKQNALCGFVVGAVDPALARRQLAKYLPGYMIPASIIMVDTVPHLPNGKIDTSALLSLQPAVSVPRAPPQSFAEKTLAGIWAELLGHTDISRNDNFFELGGDSLKTIALGLKAEEAGLGLAPHEVFEYPVLADLAAHIHDLAETSISTSGDNTIVLTHETGDKPLFFMVHGSLKMHSYLNRALGSARPLAFLFSHYIAGEISTSDRIEDLATNAVTRLKVLKPTGPYHLGGFSLGAIIALEMAHQLRISGETVSTLFLLDPSYALRKPKGTTAEDSVDHLRRFAHYAAGQVLMTYYKTARSINDDAGKARRAYIGNAYRKLLSQYQPPIYPGPVDVAMTRGTVDKLAEAGWLSAALPQMQAQTLAYEHLDLQRNPDALLAWTSALAVVLNADET